MKITYLKLENVAGIKVGSNRNILEIDFSQQKNNIVSIQGSNGIGKTVLLSSLSPFAYVTSLDDRSSLPYISIKKNGYKEIHYKNNDDEFVIKHFYKASKDNHTVKSYISMNGNELNENGNVTSFLSMVEIHLSLTQDMLRLNRIGTNVNSFITLKPAQRKEYIGKLIVEIDSYLKIYKLINDDIKVTKAMITHNNTNLHNCYISDIILERNNLERMNDDLVIMENSRDGILSKISEIETIERGNSLDKLRDQKINATVAITEYESMHLLVNKNGLIESDINILIQHRNSMNDEMVKVKAEADSYLITIDRIRSTIEHLELSVKRISMGNDITMLQTNISNLKSKIAQYSDADKSFDILTPSIKISDIISKINNYNQLGSMLYGLSDKAIDVYLRLKDDKRNIDEYLKKQMNHNVSRMSDVDIKRLFDQLFKNDLIVSPNCVDLYNDCPYYRFSEMLKQAKSDLELDSIDDETIRYIKVVSTNIDNILNDIDTFIHFKLTDKISEMFTEKSILTNLKNRVQLFDTTDIYFLHTIVRNKEEYIIDSNRLSELEHQLSTFERSGVENFMQQIEFQKNEIVKTNTIISDRQLRLAEIQKQIKKNDDNIGILSRYNDCKKHVGMYREKLESIESLIKPLENSANEKIKYNNLLVNLDLNIQKSRNEIKVLENRINDYDRLVKEGEDLSNKFNELSMIQEAVSTKKGIPVIYMSTYLKKIRDSANKLLEIIYDGELKLSKFVVTHDAFEVPYKKNGHKIDDVKYASQSEISLMTMALSFALASKASDYYNILLLDEIDAGLDEVNRSLFLKMLYRQMSILNTEQVFIISHNLSQMINMPMDVIQLSDVGNNSKLQNIIYS